ncbi:MAG: aminomethyltransferase beta-barrel domain-containing protein, partial [Ilumatobacteraceae bacterium]
PVGASVMVQSSAHGAACEAVLEELVVSNGRLADRVVLRWREQQRRVAPGQSVVMYDVEDRVVIGGGIAA